jgi:hypothetical protein
MYFLQQNEIDALEQAIDVVRKNAKVNCLLIVRGLPGMGKVTI